MLKGTSGAAFKPFAGLTSLQQAPCGLPAPYNVSHLQSVALENLHQAAGPGEQQHSPHDSHEHSQSLSDGRMDVGTHLPLMAKRYAYLSLLGEGSSAQVILAEDTWQTSGQLVAIKVMRRQYIYTGQKEIRVLRYLHAHGPPCMGAVKLLGSFTHAGHLCLVLERLHSSLLDYLSHSASLAPAVQLSHLRQIAFQLLGTMAVMHAHGVVHADLKPENILLRRPVQEGSSDCPQLVITDFGSAFSTSETDTSRVACEMQTLPYRAPEVVAGQGVTLGAALDVWSLGCILAELVLKRPLFPCNTPSQLLTQMDHMLNLPPEGQRCSVDHRFVTSDLSHASHGRDGVVSHGDKDLIAQLADEATGRGRSAPKQAMSSWQGRLSRLGLELAKVDSALCNLILQLLSWDPPKRLSTVDALLHPFFDALSPIRYLLQVAPCGVKGASAQHPRPCSLHGLVQHVAVAAQSQARPAKGSRAVPTPSCPTPIQHCRGADEAPAAAGCCIKASLASSGLQQAISAPQLQVAGALALDSAPSVGDAQQASVPEAVRGAGTRDAWATANPSLHCEGSSMVQVPSPRAEHAMKASASASEQPPDTAQGFMSAGLTAASQPVHHSPGLLRQPSDQEMDQSRGASDAAGLPEAMLPWLHAAQQAARGHQQAAEQSVEQQMGSACAVSAVARSETGRSGAGAKQALFLEIQSRLPPRLPGQAGYTDAYDFPDSVLAVADSFLRDAPASQEQPELGAAPALSDAGAHACSAAAAATEAATSSAPHSSAGACLPPPVAVAGTGGHMASRAPVVCAAAHASPQHAAAADRSNRAEPSSGLRQRQKTLSAAHEAALRAAAQHALPAPRKGLAPSRQMQGGLASTGAASAAAAAASAVTGGPDMVRDLAERSCRSSVTPHKAESRGGNAGENFVDSRKPGSAGAHMALQQPGGYSNSSQAAHESQAGISVSVRPVDVCVPAASHGAPGGAEHERRGDHDNRQQPKLQMGSPSRGLDMLAAAASRLGGVPKHVAKAAQQAKRTGAAASPAGKTAKPSRPSAPPASPSQKRKFTMDVNALHSPTKKQRSNAVSSTNKSIPVSPGKVQQHKAARPKTPTKARASPGIRSPRSRQQPEGSGSRPQSGGRALQSDAAEHRAKKVKRAAEKTPSRAANRVADPEDAGSPIALEKGGRLSRHAAWGRQHSAEGGTPSLRDRASMTERVTKPWWVV